jgi:HD-GYP domain-containing protein (c-di-GMP phosphodiesterase class II)
MAGLLTGALMSSPVLVGLGAALAAVAVTDATLAAASRIPAEAPARSVSSSPQFPQPATPLAAPVPVAPSAALAPVPPKPRVPVVLEPRAVLTALADAVRHVAQPVGISLWLEDESSDTLRQVAATGPMPPPAQPLPAGDQGVMGRACSGGTAEIEEIARIRGAHGTEGLWRFAVPVDAGDHRGVAAIDFRSAERPDTTPLPEATAHLRSALAGSLALHIAQTDLGTARALVEAARELSRVLDPEEVLSVALTRAMEMSGGATGSIMLLDPETDRLEIALARGLPEEVVKRASLADGEGIAGWVMATRQPLMIEDLPTRSPAARRHGVRSAVSVPIADDDGTLGVLNVGSRSFPARFGESHLSVIEALGRQTATALRNARAIAESRALYFDTLRALALALETKDPYSRGGTDRVLEYADALGTALGLTAGEHEALRIASLLHDIGMTAVGDGVTTSDRPLTTIERGLLKMHPQLAAEILAEAPALRQVVPIVYHHHEWYDGQGYLAGLAGESIPVGARILAVADAYVAMTSDRPYRRALTVREALAELEDKAGTQFDSAVVAALRDILRGESDRVPFM